VPALLALARLRSGLLAAVQPGRRANLAVHRMDQLSDFDRWPEMATGDPEGRALMQRLESMIDELHASVILDVESQA